MLLVTGIVAVALAFWARWLGRRDSAPRFVRHLAWVFGAFWLIGAIGTGYGIMRSFGAVSGESVDPSQKARILAEGISEAINVAAASAALLVIGAIVMLALTWRYHWAARPPGPSAT